MLNHSPNHRPIPLYLPAPSTPGSEQDSRNEHYYTN